MRGRASTSRSEQNTSLSTIRNKSELTTKIPRKKHPRRSNVRSYHCNLSVRNSEKRGAQVRKHMKLRKMWATSLVYAKARNIKIG